MSTLIEWCRNPDGSPGMVWNPVTGCTPAGAGCAHCYAASIARRFWKDRKFSDVRCHPERLDLPRYWKKPRMVFVNSMSDLFHEAVPVDFIMRVLGVVGENAQHTFIILTKRPQRMYDAIGGTSGFGLNAPRLKNLWLGISISKQSEAEKNGALLLAMPAGKHIVSIEPMLEPVKPYRLCYLDWVICGAESGPGARYMHPTWARDLRDQCKAVNVPFFFKQASAGESFPDLTAAREFPKGYLKV